MLSLILLVYTHLLIQATEPTLHEREETGKWWENLLDEDWQEANSNVSVPLFSQAGKRQACSLKLHN